MDFQTTQNKLSAVIKFNAEKLTAVNATELKNELLELNKKGVNNIILDLTSTKYCDSSGLSSILTGNRLCKDTNRQPYIETMGAGTTAHVNGRSHRWCHRPHKRTLELTRVCD